MAARVGSDPQLGPERTEFAVGVLTRQGYQVDVCWEIPHAAVRDLDPAAIEEVLDQTGRLAVDVRIEAGCVDLAAGLAFGLWNVGNCQVLAAHAAAGKLQLPELINISRRFCERIEVEVPQNE